MTPEDLDQIRQIVRAEISERLGAAVVSISTDFSELRAEMGSRFDRADQRFRAIEGHLERMDTRLATTAIELAGIHKALDSDDRTERQILATQEAQQKAIDHLYAEIAELKRRLEPRQ